MKSVNQNIIEKFNDLLGEEKVKVDEPMKRHTTFRIGGPADYFLLPSSEEELSGILKICKNEELPYFILGNGSNLLVSDEGYRGVIIQLYRNYGDITVKGNEIHATAGALLSQIAAAAKNASLTGFEFAGGIPGTLGGAVVMNAGAYGGEMKDVLKEVTVMTAAGEILVLPAEKLEMGYRTSLVKTKGYLVLSAVIVLEQGNQEAIKARMKELTEQRVSKQPLEFPSAGSTFKRPEGCRIDTGRDRDPESPLLHRPGELGGCARPLCRFLPRLPGEGFLLRVSGFFLRILFVVRRTTFNKNE